MSGSRRVPIILQNRDRHLLSELGVMRIIDRETAKVVAGFGSTTRANTRLRNLTRAGILRRFFVGTISSGRKGVYTLSPRGAEIVHAPSPGIIRGQDRLVLSDRFVEHQSAVNEIYLAIKYRQNSTLNVRLLRWLTFRRELSNSVKVMPDGYCEIQTANALRTMFLEVDLGTEALTVWRQKTTYYLQLAISGEFQQMFRQPQFRLLIVARSERRLANIREVVAKQTDKIFWFATFESINRDGFWSQCWLRPTGDQRHALL